MLLPGGMAHVAHNKTVTGDRKKYQISVGKNRRDPNPRRIRLNGGVGKLGNAIDCRKDREGYFKGGARIVASDVG
jgi:hypothetical protein